MGNPRDVNLDIVGRDKTGKATRSAAKNFDQVKRRVDEVSESNKRLSLGAMVVARRVEQSAVALGKLGAAASAAGAILPGVAAGTAKFAVAAAKLGAQVAPAAAALLPLAAGVALVKRTLLAAGPAMLAAIEPLTKAWEKQTDRIGKLASQGLRPLAREFASVNFPALAQATDRIAKATNQVAVDSAKWANTAEGQAIIARISSDTAATYERLAPKVTQVAQAAARLAGRASGAAFRNFGDAAEYVADKLIVLMDSIDGRDIVGAFEKIRSYAHQAGDAVRRIGDALAWMDANAAAIERVRTALLGVAIVVGVATGGWLIAIGAALALLVMHWDKVGAAVQRVREWFQGLIDQNPELKTAIDDIKLGVDRFAEGVRRFIEEAGPGFKEFLSGTKDLIIELMPYIGMAARAVGEIAEFWLPILGALVGAILWWTGTWKTAVSTVLDAVRPFAQAIERAFEEGVRAVEEAIDTLKRIIGAVKDAFVINVRVNIPDVAGKVADLLGQLGRLPGGIGFATSPGASFATAPSFADAPGFASAGPVTFNQGPVNVDARVFLDGEPFRAIARQTVTDERSRQAWRARYGRR